MTFPINPGIPGAAGGMGNSPVPVVPLSGMTFDDDTLGILNGLIAILKDSERGYEQAADLVDNIGVKTLFSEYGNQRSGFATELANIVGSRSMDEASVPDGTPLGGLHRAFIDLRTKLSGNDDAAVLSEAERGEDTAVNAYKSALDKTLPENVREVIQRQYAAVQQTHDYVKQMRDKAKAQR